MRPKSFSVWASDLQYDAPGETWNNTPTKVEVPESLVAEGYEPEYPPPAQYWNDTQNKRDAMLTYLDTIQIRNWPECHKWATVGINSTVPLCMIWVEGQGRLLATYRQTSLGGDDIVHSRTSVMGRRWSEVTFPFASGGIEMLATDGTIAVAATNNHRAAENTGGNWVEVVISNVDVTQNACVEFSFSLGVFVIGGAKNAGGSVWHPVITVYDAAGPTVTHVTPGVPAGYPTGAFNGPDRCASSASRVLVGASATGGGTTPAVWSATNNPASWTLARITGEAELQALAYDEQAATFQAWCDDNIQESADGITWALRTTPGFEIVPNSLVIKGSYYVALKTTPDPDVNIVTFSTDRGVTWEDLPKVLEHPDVSFDTNPIMSLAWVRDRFVVMGAENGAGLPYAAFTLRLP